MSNGTLDITVTGWVGSDVTTLPAQDGRAAYTTFRLGSTRRWWNRATGAWQDSQTEWFQVKAWRALAVNAGLSLRKGVPVVVQGRLSTREWQDVGGAVRTSLVLEATSVGIDLSYGTVGPFQRTLSGAAAQSPEEERGERQPVDLSALAEAPQGQEDDGLVDAADVLTDDRTPDGHGRGDEGDEGDGEDQLGGAGVLATSRA
jgi:single-strand DNA-binding protein